MAEVSSIRRINATWTVVTRRSPHGKPMARMEIGTNSGVSVSLYRDEVEQLLLELQKWVSSLD